jgi:hypothetical protein
MPCAFSCQYPPGNGRLRRCEEGKKKEKAKRKEKGEMERTSFTTVSMIWLTKALISSSFLFSFECSWGSSSWDANERCAKKRTVSSGADSEVTQEREREKKRSSAS